MESRNGCIALRIPAIDRESVFALFEKFFLHSCLLAFENGFGIDVPLFTERML